MKALPLAVAAPLICALALVPAVEAASTSNTCTYTTVSGSANCYYTLPTCSNPNGCLYFLECSVQGIGLVSCDADPLAGSGFTTCTTLGYGLNGCYSSGNHVLFGGTYYCSANWIALNARVTCTATL